MSKKGILLKGEEEEEMVLTNQFDKRKTIIEKWLQWWGVHGDGPMLYRPMTDCVKLSVNQKLRQPAYDGNTSSFFFLFFA